MIGDHWIWQPAKVYSTVPLPIMSCCAPEKRASVTVRHCVDCGLSKIFRKVGGSYLVDRRFASSAHIPSINMGKRGEPVADQSPGFVMEGRSIDGHL